MFFSANELRTKKTDFILSGIRYWQNEQKVRHHSHPRWQEASRHLKPMFSEMARRQEVGLI